MVGSGRGSAPVQGPASTAVPLDAVCRVRQGRTRLGLITGNRDELAKVASLVADLDLVLQELLKRRFWEEMAHLCFHFC